MQLLALLVLLPLVASAKDGKQKYPKRFVKAAKLLGMKPEDAMKTLAEKKVEVQGISSVKKGSALRVLDMPTYASMVGYGHADKNDCTQNKAWVQSFQIGHCVNFHTAFQTGWSYQYGWTENANGGYNVVYLQYDQENCEGVWNDHKSYTLDAGGSWTEGCNTNPQNPLVKPGESVEVVISNFPVQPHGAGLVEIDYTSFEACKAGFKMTYGEYTLNDVNSNVVAFGWIWQQYCINQQRIKCSSETFNTQQTYIQYEYRHFSTFNCDDNTEDADVTFKLTKHNQQCMNSWVDGSDDRTDDVTDDVENHGSSGSPSSSSSSTTDDATDDGSNRPGSYATVTCFAGVYDHPYKGCFTGMETVQMEDGSHKMLSQVTVGDKVIAYSTASHQKVVSDVVAVINHGDHIVSDFVEIATAEDKIRLTKSHLINAGDCSADLSLVAADSVNVGQCVLTADNAKTPVTAKAIVKGHGLMSIVTNEEFIVVDNLVVSPFETNHFAANLFYNIHRTLYKVAPAALSYTAFTQFNAIATKVADFAAKYF